MIEASKQTTNPNYFERHEYVVLIKLDRDSLGTALCLLPVAAGMLIPTALLLGVAWRVFMASAGM